ncbi:SpaH/EbpB family LPXTG-anchored major pilin [Bifidobacterium adolescentis]|uniref:Isopeptide-forming domain-containing fimbrial protein n=1 Tax=Bifidobacterium adolescentis TaxID=1680 RepID=A0A412K661_BIFAD|nr:SpaH/EbpB family LPXTG-anchored major pilin [Bifidobacterium adolescentis]RGS64185.1 isopeptide-forming domain-containing fimbrial protein [Bifidobacterium adolescentis]
MNKVLKGLVAVAATAAMAVAGFAGASTAMAVDGNTVNVTVPGAESNLNGHAYTAYQILSGTQATSGGALGDAAWGSGINGDAFLTALKADTTIGQYFENVTDAKGFAEALSNTGNFPTDGANTRLVAKIAMKNTKGDGTVLASDNGTQLDKGYYLIVDSTADGQTVYNPAVLAITSDITITDKTDVPTLEKKVQENKKDATDDTAYGSKFNDVADYNIGDDVPFHLIGSVPDMSQYETYTYKFTDTFDKGFDAVDTSNVEVYLSNDKKLDLEGESVDTDITSYFSGTDGSIQYTPATEAQGETAGTKATLTVSTKDLKKAATYSKEQPQYVIVSYTAKLNAKAEIGLPGNVNEAYLTYSNKPDQSGTGDNNTNDTPHDKVIVFTYGLDVTKVDSKNTETKLKDAEFKLKNSDGKWATITDGKVTGWADTELQGSVLKSDESGKFKVEGLDDGEYTLKETKAPAGYNLPADGFSVTLTATTANNQAWDGTATKALTNLAVKVGQTDGTGDVTTGLGAITIKNTQGSSLPSTGGMGTVLLYVAGIAVFVLAGATLVMALRRRNA